MAGFELQDRLQVHFKIPLKDKAMDQARILIVEDEAIVSRQLSESLRALGYYPVGWAITGEQAVAMTEEHSPSLVLMDIRLPGAIDGIDAALEIRRRFRTPVIFLTAYSDDDSLERAKLAQPYGYIIKPFDGRDLKSAITMALHKHRADEEIRRLSRLYDVLSQVNKAVAGARSGGELFSLACQVMVERGGADAARIGLLAPKGCRIVPLAHCEVRGKEFDGAAFCAFDLDQDPCDRARAILADRLFICNCEGRDTPCPGMGHARMSPAVWGWFPFRSKNERAVFYLAVSEKDYFGPREINLLEQLGLAISFALDKLEAEARQMAAGEALRASEERMRLFIEHAPAALALFDREMRYLCVSNRWLSDFKLEQLDLTGVSHYQIFPEFPEQLKEVHRRALYGEVLRGECDRFDRLDGTVQWLRWEVRPWHDATGAVAGIIIFGEDITEARQAAEALRIERDLAFGLGSIEDLDEAMQFLLAKSIELGRLDSGGIYLLDRDRDEFKLVCHHGVSAQLAESLSFIARSSPQGSFFMRGKAGYWTIPDATFSTNEVLEREGIRSVAVVPVIYQGEVIASLHLASHADPEIPGNVRSALELSATHIGSIFTRLQLAGSLRTQEEHLREKNGALRVLLKQREEDRVELEESLLENVRQRVLPYLEKLWNTRPAENQKVYLEIIESHLKDITSPFIRRASSRFIGLTSTEMRVVDLIRHGKTSKEIAKLLGTAETTVLSHRQSIRNKLGLKDRKINMHNFLNCLMD